MNITINDNFDKKPKIHLIELIDLSKCRLCQHNDGTISIQSKNNYFSQYIVACTKISVAENDSLPQSICNKCAKKLEDFYNFQTICLRINEQLNELLQESKTIPELIIGGDNKKTKSEHEQFNNDSVVVDDVIDSPSIQINMDNGDVVDDDEDDLIEEEAQKVVEEHARFVCNYNNECTSTFNTKAAFRIHRFQAHNIREFVCKICGKSFGRSGHLKGHEKTHVRAFNCNNCNKSFPQMYLLKQHIKLHHEGHRYYCSTCGQSFLTPPALKRHEFTHTGIKNFKCDTCTMAFYTKQELDSHKRYHQGIRPFVCPVCAKTYIRNTQLRAHLRIHTGDKPYHCDVIGCQKSFSDSGRLKRHKTRVHHLVVPLKVRSVPRLYESGYILK